MKLNLAAFDDDKVAGSAVDYLYAPGNKSKTQTFLKSNGFPSAQEREFNKAMQGVEQERKNLAATLKSAVKGTASTEHYGESDRGFLKGLLGDEEGEREYQTRVANVNAENTRKQNELLNAFKGSQFESLLNPTATVAATTRNSVQNEQAQDPYAKVLNPLREYNTTQYIDTKTTPSVTTKSRRRDLNEDDKSKLRKTISKEKNWVYDTWNYAEDITWKTAALGAKAIGWNLTADLLWLASSGSGKTYSAPPGSYASNLAKNDTGINKFVNDMIWAYGTSQNNPNPKIPTQSYEVPLNNGDLGAALHNVKVDIDASRDSNGVWTATVTLKDTFDFTEFKNPFKQESLKKGLLWFANDIAYYDTKWGLLDPVGVSITYQKNF